MTSRQTVPAELVIFSTAYSRRVNVARGTVLVPESAAGVRRAVSPRRHVVVTIMRAEHHAVVPAECIPPGVTPVPGHLQPVVVCLGPDSERTVLGVVPVAVVARPQVEPQLISAGRRQLTEQFVAEPVVAHRVVETDLKLRPRTVEELGPVDVLLDQQRDAVGCRTFIYISKLYWPPV